MLDIIMNLYRCLRYLGEFHHWKMDILIHENIRGWAIRYRI
jgi:hypothetical protein